MENTIATHTIPKIDMFPTTTTSEPRRLQETDRPEVFLSRFRNSDLYREAFENFLASRKIRDTVTDGQKHNAFENSDACMLLMYEFFMRHCRYEYNPMRHPPHITQKITEYIEAIQDYANEVRAQFPDRDRIVNADIRRTARHLGVADAFFRNGICNTKRQGEFFARIIVVQNGLEEPPYLIPEDVAERARQDALRNSGM